MREVALLVVGGSVAGVAVAVSARRHYPDASVLVVRPEQDSVIPCGIPYLFGTVGSCDRNLMPAERLSNSGADLAIDRITAIDRQARTATAESGMVVHWDRLVLATGSLPVVPPIPGADLPGVYAVHKSVDYLNRLLAATTEARRVVFVGGGLIGLELADEFRKRHIDVTVVEMLPRCLDLVFDDDLCLRAESELMRREIRLRTGTRLTGIEGNGKVEGVTLDDGDRLAADMVVFGIGVRPNTALARDAGLALAPDGSIAVDRYLRTADPRVFAVGDCASKTHYLTGLPTGLRLASIAASEAHCAGANLYDLRREFLGAVGVYSTKIGSLAMGLAGLGEKQARGLGIDYVIGAAEATDKHPRAMPGTSPVSLKLVFRRHSRVLIGGQVAGGDTTGEITNLIGLMVQQRLTADAIAAMQYGTHPTLTASPGMYPFPNAAEAAIARLRR